MLTLAYGCAGFPSRASFILGIERSTTLLTHLKQGHETMANKTTR
jgi:hypothetical protein